MKRSRIWAGTALATVGLVSLAACGGRGEDPSPGSTSASTPTSDQAFAPGIFEKPANSEPVQGGTLTYADYSETRSLDPAKTIATGFSGGTSLVAVYDQLVRWNVREQKFEPRIAEAVTPNDNHTEWTIKVRSGVKFSDGTPVNADAVLGSFKHYIDSKGYDLAVAGPQFKGMEKVDDQTVKISLKSSWATFEYALGMGLGFIAAPASYADPNNFKPIGAGAFTFDSYKPQEELVLNANPNYWDGKPYLDKLRFVWLGTDETKSESLKGGQVQAAVLRDIKTVKAARDADYSGWIMVDNLGNQIMANAADGRPGKSLKVRKAIATAVNPEAVYQRAFNGLGLPSKHLFNPVSKWHVGDAKITEFNTEEAKKVLAEAKAEGFDGKVVLSSLADPVSRDQALALQAQLEAAGFTVQNDQVRSVADMTSKVFIEKNYDFARNSVTITDADPYWRLYSAFYSTSAANVLGYADPEMDKLIDELRATAGDDRAPILKKIEARYQEQLPTIALGGTVTFVAWDQKVHGPVPSNDAMIGFEKTWIAKS